MKGEFISGRAGEVAEPVGEATGVTTGAFACDATMLGRTFSIDGISRAVVVFEGASVFDDVAVVSTSDEISLEELQPIATEKNRQ